ncbi:MAG: 3-oxoacyl-ACP reductase FabG [Chthonomonadaceae bacterium]|nr:3-oxoacyl-ACP reductase FabG [Chthonomonadaceae bacterium]
MILESRVALVTGASRGIGRAVGVELARMGATVACLATSEKNAQATVDVISQTVPTAISKAWGCDVSDPESVDSVVKSIEAELGTIGILVNNAGVTRDTLLVRMSDEDWSTVIDTNLKGVFNCCRAVIRGMMKARWGRIINITSIVGLHGAAGQVNYAASKAGIVGLTMSIAKETGSRGITCNSIAPGFIETDMTADLPEDMREHVCKTAPVARLGTPEDIAKAVVFLAGEGSSYITGQTLTVDGGLSL